jgi:hypothetical protein
MHNSLSVYRILFLPEGVSHGMVVNEKRILEDSREKILLLLIYVWIRIKVSLFLYYFPTRKALGHQHERVCFGSNEV